MVVLGTGAAVWFERSAQNSDRRAATHRASDQELEAISARYQAAKGEFERSNSFYGRPPSVESVCDVVERLAHAVEELSDEPELRVKELATALGFAQQLASATFDKYENDVEPAFAVYRAQYTCADVEARLRRAEQELATARATR
jgi:hypothetical protein